MVKTMKEKRISQLDESKITVLSEFDEIGKEVI